MEREGSLGYIEGQDVQALRRSAKRAGVRVVWLQSGMVRITGPSGRAALITVNEQLYEAIAQIEQGQWS